MTATKRKMFNVEPRLLQALEFFARDRRVSVDELADEALRDLLKKHGRPLTLKDALQESARTVPANDPGPKVDVAQDSHADEPAPPAEAPNAEAVTPAPTTESPNPVEPPPKPKRKRKS